MTKYNNPVSLIIFVLFLVLPCTALSDDVNQSFQYYKKQADQFNNKKSYETAIWNYKEALRVSKTKKEKTISLSSLIVVHNTQGNKNSRDTYITKLYKIPPNNKWANKFIKK